MTRPWRQSGRYGATVARAATRCPLVAALLHVGEERSHLPVGPAMRDGRHLVPALADQLLEALPLREQSIGRDVRPEAALSLGPVALRARALPLAASECAVRCGEPRGEVGLRLHVDDRLHRCVEDPAELAAPPAVRSGAVGFEP